MPPIFPPYYSSTRGNIYVPVFVFVRTLSLSAKFPRNFSFSTAETHSHTPSPTLSPTNSDPSQPEETGFNNLMVVCAVLYALGLNTMLHCVFQCANHVLTEPLQWFASRRLNSGLKKKEMVALPTSTYTTPSADSPSSSSANSHRAICLAEFGDGEKIRLLPKCNHRFHVVCIDKWLLSHSSCPTCRHLIKSSDFTHSLHIVMT